MMAIKHDRFALLDTLLTGGSVYDRYGNRLFVVMKDGSVKCENAATNEIENYDLFTFERFLTDDFYTKRPKGVLTSREAVAALLDGKFIKCREDEHAYRLMGTSIIKCLNAGELYQKTDVITLDTILRQQTTWVVLEKEDLGEIKY